jgi:nitrate/nitrite transport system substrate-binding protein
MDRRSFLRLAAAAGVGLPLAGGALAACGGDDSGTTAGTAGTTAAPGTTVAAAGSTTTAGPPKKVKIGFIALTDASSVIMAQELGYFAERGIEASVEKQASWPALRDALVNGDIDAAHCLYSMPLSLATIGNQPDNPLRVAMVLNMNGQAITLNAKDFAGVKYADLAGLKSKLEAKPEKLAMTYPGGTHDMWLRYTLMAAKYAPKPEQIIPIPPPQMVENMRAGTMSGYCVGEPWNAKAVADGIGFTFITTQDIWQDHPEKALVVGKKLSEDTEALSRIMGAVLQAGKWLDVPANRKEAAQTVSPEKYINTPAANIEGRLTGVYDLGSDLGTKDFAGKQMQFFKDGYVNAPRRAYGIWALAQYRRFGYLSADPDYEALVDKFFLTDLYAEVAKAEGIEVPDDDMKPFTVQLDKNEFDPANPTKEATRA